MSSEIQPIAPTDLAAETNVFVSYLAQLGLPTENVIAATEERSIVSTNLQSFLSGLPAEEKRDARYLSKFVGATAIGLFDAALNYVWNEVVLNLRKKVEVYGVELFFDAAVGAKQRENYKDASDLPGLKDVVLLNTCQKLEIISDIVYRKLDHILTMRNEVAASHPNIAHIGGYELLGWLQTCVKDVLQDRPSESAIRIRQFVDNLKNATTVVDAAMVTRFTAELKNLSPAHVNNMVVTLFGIYASPDTNQILKKNISTIAPFIWNHANERVKYSIGATIDGYRTNLQQERLAAGIEFLTLVNGRRFETIPAKIIALENLCDQLNDAHNGRDNYYNEPQYAREIMAYFSSSVDIPEECIEKLVQIMLLCRLGRGLSYQEGVSPGGRPLYDRFFSLLDDEGIAALLVALYTPRINVRLENSIRVTHLISILQTIRTIAISERMKEAIDFLLAAPNNAYKASSNKDFRELTKSHIDWR